MGLHYGDVATDLDVHHYIGAAMTWPLVILRVNWATYNDIKYRIIKADQPDRIFQDGRISVDEVAIEIDPDETATDNHPAKDVILDLIDQYWDIAYKQGAEGKTHDNKAGDAQRVLSEIMKGLAILSHQTTKRTK